MKNFENFELEFFKTQNLNLNKVNQSESLNHAIETLENAFEAHMFKFKQFKEHYEKEEKLFKVTKEENVKLKNFIKNAEDEIIWLEPQNNGLKMQKLNNIAHGDDNSASNALSTTVSLNSMGSSSVLNKQKGKHCCWDSMVPVKDPIKD